MMVAPMSGSPVAPSVMDPVMSTWAKTGEIPASMSNANARILDCIRRGFGSMGFGLVFVAASVH